MSDIILCNRSDYWETVEEARAEWINDVFDALQIPDEVFEVADIDEYRANMNELGMEIILHSNGEVDVYKMIWHETEYDGGWLPLSDEQLIAQWKTPERVLRVDGNETYYEVHLNEWSIKGVEL